MLRRCGLIVMDSKIKINIPICISIFLLLFTYIFISSRYVVQPAYEPDAGDLTHPEFTSENSYIVKEGDWYILYYNDEPFFSNYNIDNFPDVPIIDKWGV